ncbi:hypothetical protein HaLaN_06725, partial [Haematococcus lacustris]
MWHAPMLGHGHARRPSGVHGSLGAQCQGRWSNARWGGL